jgi:hypothetical protein
VLASEVVFALFFDPGPLVWDCSAPLALEAVLALLPIQIGTRTAPPSWRFVVFLWNLVRANSNPQDFHLTRQT